MDILLVSQSPDAYAEAMGAFGDAGFTVTVQPTHAAACAALQAAQTKPALVILDEGENRTDGDVLREQVMRLIEIHVFTMVSAITAISQEEFHDSMEGLGMLFPMPSKPQRSDGERLCRDLMRFVQP